MMTDLDLETGERAGTARERVRATLKEKTSAKSSSGTPKSTPTATRSDGEFRDQVSRTFARLADSREARGDEELAEILRDDGEIMGQGIMSAVKAVPRARMPLFFLFALVEPLLAFGRVGRVLMGRWYMRRAVRNQVSEDDYAAADTANH